MRDTPPDYLGYWGKAQPSRSDGPRWHPLAYHSLDVAAVAAELLVRRPATLRIGSELLCLSPDEARQFIPALIALHDLGKCGDDFQLIAREFARWPSRGERPKGPRHTEIGLKLWVNGIGEQVHPRLCGGKEFDLRPLLEAVFGHHGAPLLSESPSETAKRLLPEHAVQEVLQLASDLVGCFLPNALDRAFQRKRSKLASWWLAGFVTLADWVGSNEEWFGYTKPELSLGQYLHLTRERAARAVAEAGLVSPRARVSVGIEEFIGGDHKPTMAQRWAESVELPDAGPTLIILEDVTGSGKTEAAQMLVHRLMSSGQVAGAYWGLPTQATANSMYLRQEKALRLLFDSIEPAPSLVLAHGQAKLHPAFRKTIVAPLGRASESTEQSDESGETDVLSSSASCAAYLAHDRRLALLADLGAGTVDQALLAVLPVRFNALRLQGLAGKVLILDEVHAYDAYVAMEISALLTFIASLGGSAVLLSATLPMTVRDRLERAWREGAAHLLPGADNRAEEPVTADPAYPCAVIISGVASRRQFPLQPESGDDRNTRNTPIKIIRSESEAVEFVLRAARRGAAVAWIRNTVASCLEAAQLLLEEGVKPRVFHSRFAQCDRHVIEAELTSLLGPQSVPVARHGVVVVATQVVEQSLDLDFDAMVTDLAPVDLVIQRGGRLRRHRQRDPSRPVGIANQLAIVIPSGRVDDPAAWLARLPKGSKHVYAASVLWRSAGVLEHEDKLCVPAGVRDLVEAVYTDAVADLPDIVQRWKMESEGDALGRATVAAQTVVSLQHGYEGSHMSWGTEARASTRLSEPSTTVRLARLVSDELEPWCDDTSLSADERWRLSELRIPSRKLQSSAMPHDLSEIVVNQVRATWGRYDRECVLIPLTAGPTGPVARLKVDGGRVLIARYGSGLTLEPEGSRPPERTSLP